MTAYKNLIQDFPQRCIDFLIQFEKQAKECDREVTLMLAVASVSLVIPYERLEHYENPSGDAKKYVKAKGKFANDCGNENFIDWIAQDEGKSWKFKELDLSIINQDPESWLIDAQCLTGDRKVGSNLKHLRNAFAHGNIFILPESGKIKTLIFLSQRKNNNIIEGYNLIEVLPEDFYDFLIKWIGFLKSLNLLEPKVD